MVDPICSIENLSIIDTGSNTSLAAIRKRKGKDFEINVFPPVEALVKGADRKLIEDWLAQTIKDNDGGNLKIEYHLEADYNWDNCNYIHQELERLGIVKMKRLY